MFLKAALRSVAFFCLQIKSLLCKLNKIILKLTDV